MLTPFDNLWFPALCTIVLGTWILKRFLNLSGGIALMIAVVKAAIPLIYFARFYDGRWNLIDDISYFNYADLLRADGWNPLQILMSERGLNQLFNLAGSNAIFYYWWNLLALYCFSPYYSSPIFLNVISTFVSAVLMYKIARVSGCVEKYAKGLAVFLLLHWDVLAWSSFLNIKDIYLLMLTLASVYSGIQFARTKSVRHLVLLSAYMFLFLWIRFYIPVFLLAALGVWLAFAAKGWLKIPWIVLTAVSIYLVLPADFIDAVRQYSTGDWFEGSVRVMLSPQPWTLSKEYTFLLIPSSIHWILFVPACIATIGLARRNQVFRLAAIYFLMIVAVYATVPSQAGPRHRLQAMWVMIWAQFDFVWLITRRVFQRISTVQKEPSREVAPVIVGRKV